MFFAYNNYKKLSDGDEIKDYRNFYKNISNKIEFGGAFSNYDFLVKHRFMNFFQHVYNAALRRHPSKILDMGCGNGVNLPIANIFPSAEYHGLDYAEKAIENARKEFPRVIFHLEDAFHTSFEDNTFDMIILSNVLVIHKEEEDRVNLLKEVRRILKDDGVFLLIVWKESFFLKYSIRLSRLLARLLHHPKLEDFMAVYFSVNDIKKLAKIVKLKIQDRFHPSALFGVLESVRYLNLSKYNRVHGKSESEATRVHSQNILEDLKCQAGTLKFLTTFFYYLSIVFPNLFSHYSVYIMEKQSSA
jgi:ubiquinone/menaquinone biosynthesis C-methylase UbiE